MSLRLAIFDVDGTLVDSQTQIVAAMTAAFAAVDRPSLPPARVLGIVGLSLPVAVARLAPDESPAAHARMVAAYRAAWLAQRGAAAQLYPGALAALDRLAAQENLLLGIATGKSRSGLAHLLSELGLAGRFVTVQVADDHPSKPHPSMLLEAMSATGIAQAVMIGDTVFDMEMARAAAIPAIGVAWGYHEASALRSAGARSVIGNFEALDQALDDCWGTA